MQSSKRSVVGSVPQIPRCVEWFLHTKSVIDHQVPALALFRYQFALAHRDDGLLVVEFVAVVSKELEEKFTDRLLVLLTKIR
jgi:hypothetical protein